MVWLVEVVELADEDCKGIGKYRLIARSLEGGGTYRLCSHEHDSRKEAKNCSEARENEMLLTGLNRKWL